MPEEISVSVQKSGSTAALSFLQFSIDLLPAACQSHNPGYMLHLSASQGSWYFS